MIAPFTTCTRHSGSPRALRLVVKQATTENNGPPAGAPLPTLAHRVMASVLVLSPMPQGGANAEFGTTPPSTVRYQNKIPI